MHAKEVKLMYVYTLLLHANSRVLLAEEKWGLKREGNAAPMLLPYTCTPVIMEATPNSYSGASSPTLKS